LRERHRYAPKLDLALLKQKELQNQKEYENLWKNLKLAHHNNFVLEHEELKCNPNYYVYYESAVVFMKHPPNQQLNHLNHLNHINQFDHLKHLNHLNHNHLNLLYHIQAGR
jgi:hypothetical protein